MGNVEDRNRAAEMSKSTAASDAAHWKSLAPDTTTNISKIKAPDNVVEAVAGAVAENKPYSLQPNDGAMSKGPRPTPEVNSNSAALAVGDKSEQIASGDPGAHVDRTPFTLTLPGAGASGKVEFKCTDSLKRAGGC